LLTTTHFLPTYEPFPNFCPIGQITYEVALDTVGSPFPVFITKIPTTFIEIGSIDLITEGIYNFNLIATDQLTSL